MDVEGEKPRIEYILAGDKIFLTHTEVPRKLSGRGIGSALVGRVLEEVEKTNRKLVPLCPFVAQYIKRHPQWKKLLADDINIG